MFGKIFTALALVSLVAAAPVSPAAESSLEKRTSHTGRATWFDVGLGNCGWYSQNSDYVLAMSEAFYDENNGANCGQGVYLKNTANGNTAYAVMVDSCPGCSRDQVDLSPSLFKALASDGLGEGELTLTWHFLKR
ncbi:RlpA-like double-psi beta-barrel-protein domain-containing protein-containing protein, partial [Naematelia encephala]